MFENYTEKQKEIDSKKVASEHHIKCHDCGHFLKRRLWVPKNHPWKKHALCRPCFSLYDPPEY